MNIKNYTIGLLATLASLTSLNAQTHKTALEVKDFTEQGENFPTQSWLDEFDQFDEKEYPELRDSIMSYVNDNACNLSTENFAPERVWIVHKDGTLTEYIQGWGAMTLPHWEKGTTYIEELANIDPTYTTRQGMQKDYGLEDKVIISAMDKTFTQTDVKEKFLSRLTGDCDSVLYDADINIMDVQNTKDGYQFRFFIKKGLNGLERDVVLFEDPARIFFPGEDISGGNSDRSMESLVANFRAGEYKDKPAKKKDDAADRYVGGIAGLLGGVTTDGEPLASLYMGGIGKDVGLVGVGQWTPRYAIVDEVTKVERDTVPPGLAVEHKYQTEGEKMSRFSAGIGVPFQIGNTVIFGPYATMRFINENGSHNIYEHINQLPNGPSSTELAGQESYSENRIDVGQLGVFGAWSPTDKKYGLTWMVGADKDLDGQLHGAGQIGAYIKLDGGKQ